MAPAVNATARLRSIPWSTKLRTHSSTVLIMLVSAANERLRKNADIITQRPMAPPGACANTSGRARKVIAEEPLVTTDSGSSDTAKMADRTARPAMIEMLLLARPMVAALSTVSSSLRM